LVGVLLWLVVPSCGACTATVAGLQSGNPCYRACLLQHALSLLARLYFYV